MGWLGLFDSEDRLR